MKKTLLVGIAAMLASYGFAQTQTPPTTHDKAVQRDMHKDRDTINARTKHIDDKDVQMKGDKRDVRQAEKKTANAVVHGDTKDAKHHIHQAKAKHQSVKNDRNAIHNDKKEIRKVKKDINQDKKAMPEEQK